jgi:hypothetical protein
MLTLADEMTEPKETGRRWSAEGGRIRAVDRGRGNQGAKEDDEGCGWIAQ